MTRLPFLSTAEMREVDRTMIDDFRIELIQMMENAGGALARFAALRFLDNDPFGRSVLVLCGTGRNGGGGLVAARRLHGWGARVQVMTTAADEGFIGVAAHQLDILRRLEVSVSAVTSIAALPDADVVIDAIIGYGLDGPPRGEARRLIELANGFGSPVASLDVPSGVDADDGRVHEPAVSATATLTLALPKRGLRTAGPSATGELWLADIGVPRQLYASPAFGLNVGALFSEGGIVRIDQGD